MKFEVCGSEKGVYGKSGDEKMKLGTKVEMKPIKNILKDRGLEEHGRAQQVLDSEVVRLCSPYVPVDSGTLQQSADFATDFGSGEVIYSTPYARRIYYTHKGQAANSAKPQDTRAGKLWFERMKADHLDDIIRTVRLECGADEHD
jgi:hypothetical protein